MKKLTQLFLFLWAISALPAMSQVGKICNWDNDKKAAIVLTFDDWSPGHGPIVVPELKARNLIATFYVMNNTAQSDWKTIKIAAANGNEIGNHTKTHPSTLTTASAIVLADEITGMKTLIDQNITAQKAVTFAYPFGNSSASIINELKSSGHFAGRSVSPGTYSYKFASTINDYFSISTYSMDGTITNASFNGQIQNVINGGGLLTFLYHSVDTDAGTYGDNWFAQVKQSALQTQLDNLAANKNKAWITTMAQAVKYHKEKNSATLTEVQVPNSTQWVLNLTDTLANNTVYNQPLTLKLKTKGVKYASVKQNGVAIKIDSVYSDTIMFKAVPDAGTIILAVDQNANTKNLSVKDSTFNNGVNTIPVYVITWTDNNNKPRTAIMAKSFAGDNYPGICVRFKYYDAANKLITINSATPSAPKAHERGFGATVHHLNDNLGGFIYQGTNMTLTLRSKGEHYAFIDLVQDVDGAKETVTYAFYDGLDYFQWQETVKCGPGSGTFVKDSRGPYLTMDWDGNGAFDVIDGQEYGAQKYLKQPSYTANSGAYTFNGTCDIPYVQEWKGTSEVGYVQTQTYTQQLAGSPDFSATNIPATGTVNDLNTYSWALDFQMNIFDKLQKMTWGMPYGYMDGKPAPGLTSTGTKAGYGQYSLSVVFDALSAGGVKRIIAENRIIQNAVTLTATLGSVVTTGPVGSANPTMQTLVPAGYDHNYRAWWLQGNTSDQAQVTMNIATGSLKNPTFRIKSFTQVPNVVSYNGNLLVANTDYYASYDATNTEAWVTLLKDVSGSNSILFQGNSTGITINSAKVTPASVSNNAIANLVFDVAATVGGTVKSVTLDLTAIGGGAAVAMTKGTTNYGFTYAMPAGITLGSKIVTVTVTVTDNVGSTNTATIPVTITSGTVVSSATVNPASIVNNVSNPLTFTVSATDDGSITGVTLNLSTIGGGAAVAMTKGATDYTLSYTAAAGITEGDKAIVATVTDNQGNKTTKSITLTVNTAVVSTAIYTDKATMINGTWGAPTIAQGGTIDANIIEQSNLGAQEGVKDYIFSFSMFGYYAGFGLNVSNWGSSQKDFSTYDTLQIAYKGPFTTGTGITVMLTTAGGTVQSAQSTIFPATSTYKVVKVPLSAFTGIDLKKVEELDFVIKGPQTGAGTLNIDNIILIKKVVITNALSDSELNTANSGLSVYPNPSNGTFTIASEMEGYYSILNSLGQTVQQVSLNSSNGYSRQIENLESGLYVIVGNKGSRKINQKLVVTK